MNRKGFAPLIVIGIVAVILIIGVAGYFVWKHSTSSPPQTPLCCKTTSIATSTTSQSATTTNATTAVAQSPLTTSTSTGGGINSVDSAPSWSMVAGPNGISEEGPTVIDDGYAYTEGTSTIFYAKIDPATGNLGAWSNLAAPPMLADSMVASNGYIYVFARQNDGAESLVSYAKIDPSNGKLGSWLPTTPPIGLTFFGPIVVNNNYMYLLGGAWDGGDSTSTVFYSSINPQTGALGSWLTTTPAPGSGPAIVNNGYIYDFQYDNLNPIQSHVAYSRINSNDGTLGSWSALVNGPPGLIFEPITESGGVIYGLGGYDGDIDLGMPGTPGATTTVSYTDVDPTSSALVGWSTMTPLPVPILEGGSAIANNGYIYLFGAALRSLNPSETTSTIFFIKVGSNPTSTASGLVPFNSPFTINIGLDRYVGESVESNIDITLNSIEISQSMANIGVSFCPLAGACEMNPSAPVLLTLNQPQALYGFTYDLTALTNATATIVVSQASQ